MIFITGLGLAMGIVACQQEDSETDEVAPSETTTPGDAVEAVSTMETVTVSSPEMNDAKATDMTSDNMSSDQTATMDVNAENPSVVDDMTEAADSASQTMQDAAQNASSAASEAATEMQESVNSTAGSAAQNINDAMTQATDAMTTPSDPATIPKTDSD